MVAVRSGGVNWIGVGCGDDLWLPQWGIILILDSWRNFILPPKDDVPHQVGLTVSRYLRILSDGGHRYSLFVKRHVLLPHG
jgi:hypothetical protein